MEQPREGVLKFCLWLGPRCEHRATAGDLSESGRRVEPVLFLPLRVQARVGGSRGEDGEDNWLCDVLYRCGRG